MKALTKIPISSLPSSPNPNPSFALRKPTRLFPRPIGNLSRHISINCIGSERELVKERSSSNTMEGYNTAMKRMMRNPYEYHHDLGLFFNLIWMCQYAVAFLLPEFELIRIKVEFFFLLLGCM